MTEPIKYACTVCDQGWDHYPEGDEEYGCTQEVETDEGVVYPHDYVAVDEWKERKIEQGVDNPQVTTDVAVSTPPRTTLNDSALVDLVAALRGLGDRQMKLLRSVDDETFIEAALMARSADRAQGTERSRAAD